MTRTVITEGLLEDSGRLTEPEKTLKQATPLSELKLVMKPIWLLLKNQIAARVE